MSEVTRSAIVRVGVDLAKQVIQVHAVDAAGHRVVSRALKREQFLLWCGQLPAGCMVAMEACGGAHHWARQLQRMGLQPRIMAAGFVAPYRMAGSTGKNDANDAAAVCEAASRPTMRFVPVKTPEQQALMSLHRLREGYKEERTATINRIRGKLVEFGLAFNKSPKVLRAALPEVLEDGDNELTGLARLVVQDAFAHWLALDERLAWCDERIAEHVRSSPETRRAMAVPGIGALTASAATAAVGDFGQFRDGGQFGAWLGLVPRQNSSGGKTVLGRITRRGDDYLRTLFIQGAKSALMSAHKRDDPISHWAVELKARLGWQKACVALANKNARILWAVMTRDAPFDARHTSILPRAKTKPEPQALEVSQDTATPLSCPA